MNYMRSFVLALAVCAAPLSLSAAVDSYVFDSSQLDFNQRFTATGQGQWTTETIPGWKVDGGIANTGRMQAGGDNNTAVYHRYADFRDSGDANRVTIHFQARLNGSGLISGLNNLGVGYTSRSLGTLAGGQYIAADLQANGGQQFLGLRTRESGTLYYRSSTPITLTEGHWYALSLDLTKSASNDTFAATITLDYLGADGLSTPVQLDSFSQSAGGLSTLWAEDYLYPAFQGYSQSGTGGAHGFDNFEATVVNVGQEVVYPANSGIIDVTQAPYNAAGDGVTDDTAAIQAALDVGGPSVVYFPNGTYLVSSTLSLPLVADNGLNMTLQGQSESGAVIRLADNTFTSSLAPVITMGGEHSPNVFGNSINNLTVDTGQGNTHAIGIQYYSNNIGRMRYVTIRSGDGSGEIGLDMSHSRANGPNYINHITIDGFKMGLRTGYYVQSHVAESVTLRNQTEYGWYNANVSRAVDGFTHQAAGQILTIRKLMADGLTVPVLHNPSGHVVLLDSEFYGEGAASTQAAIENGASGQLLVRNLTTSGFAQAIDHNGANVAGPNISEWLSEAVIDQFTSAGATLGLPIEDAPIVPLEDPANWANIKDYGATDWNAGEGTRFDDDAPAIQAAIDSGAKTIFIPVGSFRITQPVYIRGNVERIIGTGRSSAATAGTDPNNGFLPYDGEIWVVGETTANTLVLENFWAGANFYPQSTGLVQETAKTLVLRELNVNSMHLWGGGKTYIENLVSDQLDIRGGEVWARQLNIERDGAHIINDGGQLWVMGLKTEDWGYIIDAKNGAQTEILGGMIYSLDNTSATPMIRNVESQMSLSISEYLGFYGTPYNVLVEETANGETRQLLRGAPDYPANWSQHNDGTTTSNSGQVGSSLVLYRSATEIYEFLVTGDGEAIADGSSTTSDANHTDLGTAEIGVRTVSKQFVIANTTGADVQLTGSPLVTLSGANAALFSLDLSGLPSALAAGETASFTLSFEPLSSTPVGPKQATLSIVNSKTSDGAFDFAVSAEAIGLQPQTRLDRDAIYLTVPSGQTGTVPVHIQNIGHGDASYAIQPVNKYTYLRSDESTALSAQWLEITEGDNVGTDISANFSDSAVSETSGSLTLGFDFPFFGSNYQTVNFSEDGFARFFGPGGGAPGGIASVSNAAPSHSIAPFWSRFSYLQPDDADPEGTEVYYHQLTADTFVYSVEDAARQNNAQERISFQTVFKASGTMYFNYARYDGETREVIGLKNTDGSENLRLYANFYGTVTGKPPAKDGFSFLVTPGAADWLAVTAGGSGTATGDTDTLFELAYDTTGMVTGEQREYVLYIETDDHPLGAYGNDDRPLVLPVFLQIEDEVALQVTGLNAYTILNGQTQAIAVDGTEFPEAPVDSGSSQRSFSITNLSSGILELTGSPVAEITGPNAADFSLLTPPSSSIAAGASSAFTIGFDPSAGGTREATLRIAYGSRSYSFAISGRGVFPPDAPSSLALSSKSGSSVSINWVDNSVDESSFVIERSVAGSGLTTLVSVGENQNSYTDNAVGPGVVYSYRIRSSNAGGISAPSNELLVGTPALADLDDWRSYYFGSTDASGNAAAGADPDGDLRVNLFEYAFNSAPDQADAMLPLEQETVLHNAEDYLSLSFPMIDAAAGLLYRIQGSSDLQSWEDLVVLGASGPMLGASLVSFENTDIDNVRRCTVRDDSAVGLQSKRFMRLVVGDSWFTTDFSSSADWDAQLFASVDNNLSYDASGWIEHANGGGYQRSILFYDSVPDTQPTDTLFNNVDLSFDFRLTGSANGAGFVFYNQGDRSSNLLYYLQIDAWAGTLERSRFQSGVNAITNGNATATQQDRYDTDTLVLNTWYRMEVRIREQSASSVQVSVEVFAQGGDTVLYSDSYTYIGLTGTGGELGLYFLNASGTAGENQVHIDNFSILPE